VAADAEAHGGELPGRDKGMGGEVVERRAAVGVELGHARPGRVTQPALPPLIVERNRGARRLEAVIRSSGAATTKPYPASRAHTRSIGPVS
jgi:hypothetical protein